MKVFCIGRNYADHAREMKAEIPKEPVIFIKPQSSLLKNNMPFHYPSFSKHVEYEVELVIKICRNGRHIPEKEAENYYKEIALGIDFTARDIQQTLKEKGLPWEKAKAFDHSAPVSECFPVAKFRDLNNIRFELRKNRETVQIGSSKDMLFNFDKLVSAISKYFTINIGDLIFTGTPAGVGPVKKGDKLEGFLEGEQVIAVEIV
jgi:2-keto-4-pentenoate hydratase/2-oxohepta-3-ene-1,7-dioic acid hydratase in catechol pathway